MTRNRSRCIVALVSLVGVAFLSVAAYAQFPMPSAKPQPQATPAPVDPRADQVKAALEKQGMKVFEVTFKQTDDKEPQVLAQTAARYAQPSWKDVNAQIFAIWGAMYEVAAKDPPQMWFSGIQVWAKYGIAIHVRLEHLTALVNNLSAAKTDAEKQAAFDKFVPKTIVKFYDYERREFIDYKDFVNKNFTS